MSSGPGPVSRTAAYPGPVLIVGGGQGIGAAVAADCGSDAVVWTRSGGVDATDPGSLAAALAALQAQRGTPYALLHCVGDFHEAPLLGTSAETFRQQFASNVDSAFHTIQTVVPAMLASGRPGRVMLFAAAGVDKQQAMRRAPVYFAAKAALVQLGRSLAAEVAAAGLTVNVVAPGLIHHPHSHQPSQARMLPRVPAGRLGTPGDIVGLVRHLLDPASSYLTGQILTVDGGLWA